MKELLLVLFSIIIFLSQVNAQSTLALQEKCAEGAKIFFEKKSREKKSRCESNEKIIAFDEHYSHYNKKLDKCFIRMECYQTLLLKSPETGLVVFIEVYDIYEGKIYGKIIDSKETGRKEEPLFIILCQVEDKECYSLAEFESLTRQYLEQ